jgi:endoglucanase
VSTQRPLLSGLGMAALLLGAAAPADAAVTRAIKLDNFGYRPSDGKIAIFTSNPGPTVQVRTAGGAPVFTVPTDGGSIISRGLDPASGDQVWWVDFSPFAATGTYHLHSPSLGAESYTFAVQTHVYNEAVRAALKSFYYQRCGTPKAAEHAGAWADAGVCHAADATTGPAVGHTDRGPKDLRGGWHDAGDYNKYVWSATGTAVLYLLRAYEDNPGFFADGDMNIPESGNGIPDVLDEVRWELDWLMRMRLPDGSVLSRTHAAGFDWNSPPSADATLRYYENPTLESGAILAGTCALASRVYQGAGQTAYAATLRSAALSTWSWLQPQGNSPEKAWAAAEVFRMDPSVASAGAYVAGYHPSSWSNVFLNVVAFDTQAALTYVQTPTGTSGLVVTNMRANIANQVNYIFASDDHYRNGMPSWSYYWGSNAIRAGYGAFLMTAARLGLTGSHTAAECRAHALEFLHFFHGQNTLSMVYLTNMAAQGGEHSSWQMYHGWFGASDNASSRAQYIGKPAAVAEPFYPYFAGTDNHGINDNKASALGPAPGFVVGGPNASYGGDATPPLGSVYPNRFYRDWSDQTVWTARTWEITENSIGYQGPYVALGSYFMEPAAPASPLKLYTVAPCRLVDTRQAGQGAPALTAGEARSFTLAGLCGVPADARALAVNVTATAATAVGHLRVYPTGAPLPTASTLNYSANQARANNAIVSLGAGGAATVYCGQMTGSVHVVVDVNGYFR